MEKSRLHHVGEIDEYIEQLENAQRNFTLLAAGEVMPDEISELSLKDLANLSLLREDLKELKENLAAEPDGQNQTEKEEKLINENIELHREIRELRNKLIEYLQNDIDNKKEPQKMKVCK